MKTCRCFGRMVSNPSPVLPSFERRARQWLAALLPVVLVWGLGCGASDPTAGPDQGVETDDGEEPPRNSVMPGLDGVAEAMVALTARRWEGPRVPWPGEAQRPVARSTVRSAQAPLAVHGDGSPERLQTVLETLEGVAAYVHSGYFPRPFPDGSLGGGPAFDLYLAPTDRLGTAKVDKPLGWSFLDGVTAHALLDPGVPTSDLEPCIAQAYGEAIALEQDPAEAPGWHRALGAFLAWHYTGRFGCADALDRQQSAEGLPWIGHGELTSADHGAAGGLLLAMVSQRHDGGDGAFVRELYQLARQRTWDGTELRAAPDLWQALERSVEMGGDRFESMMEDFTVVRGFLGSRDEHSPMQALRGLGQGGAPPVVFEVALADMPHHTPTGPELQTYGTVFAMIDVRGAPPQSRLRVWLRGEYGVEWGLTGSRLDADGRELARLSAPPRRQDRRSYLPVELTPDTTHVLVGITNLSHRLPDDDGPDPNGRGFRLILDVVGEDEE